MMTTQRTVLALTLALALALTGCSGKSTTEPDKRVTDWIDAYRALPSPAIEGDVTVTMDTVDSELWSHRVCLAEATATALTVPEPDPAGVAAGWTICDRKALDWLDFAGTGASDSTATVATDWPTLAAVIADHTACVVPAVAAALAEDPDTAAGYPAELAELAEFFASPAGADSPTAQACTWTAVSRLPEPSELDPQ